METPLRRSSRRLQSRESSTKKEEQQQNVTLGPRSMAKLRKAAAKLKETESADNMNKTAPAHVHDGAQNGRKKRSRSMTQEGSVKREKVEQPAVEKIKQELTVDEPKGAETAQSAGRKQTASTRASRSRSVTSSDSSPTEEAKQTLTTSQPSSAAPKSARKSSKTPVKSQSSKSTIIKEEPESFKSDMMSSQEENLDDISLIDLTDTPNSAPTIIVTEATIVQSSSKRNSFADLVKTAEVEASIDDIPAPNFNLSAVLKTPKTVKVELLSNEGLEEIPKTPAIGADGLSETFSPVVDKTINDSRPTIDDSNIVSIRGKSLSTRTSTPFASKLMPTKTITTSCKKRATTAFTGVNDSIAVNPMEKSILKSSRKRSMSMHDIMDEHVANKRVMFISPQFMEIDKIDEKMKASFIVEKENSIMHTNPRQRRSQSAGPPSERKAVSARKMPDFKAIHEQNFKKMESIGDHVKRKAERAKKLFTPEAKKPEQKVSRIPKVHIVKPVVRTKIEPNAEPEKKKPGTPKRQPFTTKQQLVKPKVEVDMKPQNLPKFVGLGANPVKKPAMSTVAANRIKVEERRERNMGMYKTNQVQRATADSRQKNMSLLKGVRLNKRFELQMQHRQNSQNDSHGAS